MITVPGGMATLDVVINSLSDKTFWVPKYHWGSWNKILTIHNKDIKTFNDFDINNDRCVSPHFEECLLEKSHALIIR